MRKKVLVCILDGWGLGKNNSFNAIFLAKKKNFDYLTKKYGYLKLKASENDVGLPVGQFGNSEVGHTNIGAGRIILQDVMRISKSFSNGEIKNKSLVTNILEKCKRIHIVGLISKGGVHGHQDHLFELIEILNKNKPNIFIHCILDGRDSSPIGGKENLRVLIEKIGKRKNIKIASISGRFFAMDRDNIYANYLLQFIIFHTSYFSIIFFIVSSYIHITKTYIRFYLFQCSARYI